MTRTGSYSHFVGFVSSALALATPAWAQESTKAAAADESGLEEVVVTAQRRAQRLQDVPIAISAVTAESAQQMGVSGTASLVAVVPSLVFTRQANGATPYLRGVGFATGDINAENSVAMYIDGVYQPVPQGNFFEFNNIERIEVLKGPQGTLFGRNATGGVIQIVTKDPSFTPHVDVAAGYANYQTTSGSFYGTTGLSEKVAVDLAVMYSDQAEGWGRNLTTGSETFLNEDLSVRSKLLFTVGATEFVLAGDYYSYENAGIGEQPPFGLSNDPAGLTTGNPPVTAVNSVGQPFPGRYNMLGGFEDGARARNRGASLRVDHDFGALQLHSISAYRKFNGTWKLDQDMSPLNIISATLGQRAETVSQEVHLLAPTESKLQWLIGGYYFEHEAAFDPEHLASDFVFGPLSSFDIHAQTIANSKSVFAQGTYPLTEKLGLTVGARYTWDKADFTGRQIGHLAGGGSITLVPENTGHLEYKKPTGRVSLDYKFTPDVLGYVSYNRGTKSGNFSVSLATPAGLYAPEQMDAYETGLKTELFDRRVRLNGAAFYYDYENMQFQKIVQGASQTLVADSAKLYGAELEVEALATDQLTLTANIAYLHTEIGNFPYVATIRQPNGLSANTTVPYNADGNRTPSSPKYSGNVGFNYAIPTGVGQLDLSGNVYFVDKYFSEPDNRLFVDSHTLVNASVRWADPSDKFSVLLWGKNLTDEYYYAQFTGTDGVSDLAGPAAPRQYGITLGYSFE